LPKAFSTYLDAVRFLAAMLVVIAHVTFKQFTGGLFAYQGSLAAIAVTAFFVLSGYVIAYVANEKERTLQEFSISRAARVYSVAVPALLLTMAIDLGGHALGAPWQLPMYEYTGIWKYLPVILTFTNEIGTLHVPVFSDAPFWSLSYEVWYYVAFGIAFYLRGWLRLVLLFLAVIALGIPALVYFPIWLGGVGVYYLHRRTRLPRGVAAAFAILSLAAIVLVRVSGFDDWMDARVNTALGGWPFAHLNNSMHFSTHYLVGALFALNLYAVRFCRIEALALPLLRRPITYLASFTFALYLAHLPLLYLWSFVIGTDGKSAPKMAVLLVLVTASVWGFGLISEHRKRQWRVLIKALFAAVGIKKPPAEGLALENS
jgi:peptidoglycan/LPS O-acetylase OafA/YrhL